MCLYFFRFGSPRYILQLRFVWYDLWTKIAKNGHSAPSTRTSESLRKFAQLCRKKYYISRTSQPSSQIHPDKGGEWDPRVFLVVEFKGLTIFEKRSCVLSLAAVLNHALLETWRSTQSLPKLYWKSAQILSKVHLKFAQSPPKSTNVSSNFVQSQLKFCPKS